MSKYAAAKAAYQRAGLPELSRVTRRWLAIQVGLRSGAQRVPRRNATTVSYADALAWFDARRSTYEQLADAVAAYLDPSGVVLDVGANIGYFTKVLGETTGFHGTAHLFEPIPHLAQLCRETADQLPFAAEVHEYGLSDENGIVDLFVAADGNLGWNTLVAEKQSVTMTRLQVAVRRFDATELDITPSLVKIDVEGAEYKVLAGMLDALQRWSPRPSILCEIGWGPGHPAWQRELDVFDRLGQLGYRTVDLDGNPVEIGSIQRTTDIIAVPSAHAVA